MASSLPFLVLKFCILTFFSKINKPALTDLINCYPTSSFTFLSCDLVNVHSEKSSSLLGKSSTLPRCYLRSHFLFCDFKNINLVTSNHHPHFRMTLNNRLDVNTKFLVSLSSGLSFLLISNPCKISMLFCVLSIVLVSENLAQNYALEWLIQPSCISVTDATRNLLLGRLSKRGTTHDATTSRTIHSTQDGWWDRPLQGRCDARSS